jgi:hypothetical protein
MALSIAAIRLTTLSSRHILLEGATKSAPSAASLAASSGLSTFQATHGTTKISDHQR